MPSRYKNTLMFLTREMNEEASIQQRLDNLHNLWGREGFTESKKGNCHGCGAHLTEKVLFGPRRNRGEMLHWIKLRGTIQRIGSTILRINVRSV